MGLKIAHLKSRLYNKSSFIKLRLYRFLIVLLSTGYQAQFFHVTEYPQDTKVTQKRLGLLYDVQYSKLRLIARRLIDPAAY